MAPMEPGFGPRGCDAVAGIFHGVFGMSRVIEGAIRRVAPTEDSGAWNGDVAASNHTLTYLKQMASEL